jgi:hypothetical protein
VGAELLADNFPLLKISVVLCYQRSTNIKGCRVGIIETFSKRQKRLKGEVLDVFIYDDIPTSLRIQICHIWKKCLGVEQHHYMGRKMWSNPVYLTLHQELAAEFGLFSLGNSLLGDAATVVNFFTQNANTEQALDIIEMSFRFAINGNSDQQWIREWGVEISSTEAIDDLNRRFLEHGIGYMFVDGEEPQLIKINNEHLHQEAVIPALQLLHQEGFKEANGEYRKAHEHYCHGAQKECLVECLKAFESTMKTICTKRKWPHKETDTASTLIDICLKNGLLPSFMQAHLGTVKSALESAIPTVRNKMGGHGQGVEPKEVPQFYSEYLLHETAATIVFLVDAYKALK